MALDRPITLSDSYLARVVQTSSVAAAFPSLVDSVTQTKSSGCKCRNPKTTQNFSRVRAAIMSMSDSDLDRLKALLNVPGRKFSAYVTNDGRHRKTVR